MDNPSIRLYLDPGNAPVEAMVELFNSMSDMSRADGGGSLSFRAVPQKEYDATDREAINKGFLPVEVSPWTLGDTVQAEFHRYLDHPEEFQ